MSSGKVSSTLTAVAWTRRRRGRRASCRPPSWSCCLSCWWSSPRCRAASSRRSRKQHGHWGSPGSRARRAGWWARSAGGASKYDLLVGDPAFDAAVVVESPPRRLRALRDTRPARPSGRSSAAAARGSRWRRVRPGWPRDWRVARGDLRRGRARRRGPRAATRRRCRSPGTASKRAFRSAGAAARAASAPPSSSVLRGGIETGWGHTSRRR